MQKKQWKKLETLKKQKSTVIKPSDKNTGTCISTDTLYSNECWRLLSDSRTYSQLTLQEKEEFLKKAAGDLIILLQKHNVSKEDEKFLKIFLDNFDIPKFYIIWKIHKNPIVGRPIVAGCRWLTTAASIFVGEYLMKRVHKRI